MLHSATVPSRKCRHGLRWLCARIPVIRVRWTRLCLSHLIPIISLPWTSCFSILQIYEIHNRGHRGYGVFSFEPCDVRSRMERRVCHWGTFRLSVGWIILHVHLIQYDMCMSYCSTCACHAALHVHVKHPSSMTSGRFVYEVRSFPYLLWWICS